MKSTQHCSPSDDQALLEWLKGEHPPERRALVGFDGYVDTIYRVVRTRSAEGTPQYYRRIAEYGQRILDAAEKSADIDIRLIRRQMGGNAPLMADGLAALGDGVTLVGALGRPQPHPCFDALCPGVEALSFAEPCQTIALEFDDGKIMMGDLYNGEAIRWTSIMESVGSMRRQIERAGLIAVLNWSAHPGVPEIARQLAELAQSAPAPEGGQRMMFFDLSDPTSLPAERLRDCLGEIGRIAARTPVALGMNENEARVVFASLFPEAAPSADDTRELARMYGRETARRLNLRVLTIHTTAQALGFTPNECWQADGFRVEKPVLLTGGGDHYNAAFCHGLLHGLPLPQCLLLGSAAASYFVQHGRSATRGDLARTIINKEVNHP